MTFSLSSRTKLSTGFAIAVLAIVGSAALSTPASAAKQSTLVAACKRTAGCWMEKSSAGGLTGCSPNACFHCFKGKCFALSESGGNRGHTAGKPGGGNISLTNRATANDAVVHRGNAAPVQFAAPGNNHVRMSGRH